MGNTGAVSLEAAPVVAQVVRNGVVESVHRGIAVVTDASGAVVRAVGDPSTVVFPRSSLKPVQALAMLCAGAALGGPSLALACASHAGEPMHIAGVRASLAASGLTVDALRNTPDLPLGETARAAWLAAELGPESLAQNCSGKHAGMLAACVAAGWSLDDYLAPGHPLQVLIRETVTEVCGEPIVHTGVDGCGAPIHAFALTGLARAFGRLAAATPEAAAASNARPATREPEVARERSHAHGAVAGDLTRVAEAMRAHPELIGGPGRADTELMRAASGVIAKGGAEAVFAVGLPDGRGVAVKIADGHRADRVVAAALLRDLGMDAAACDALADVPVLGHGRPVGAVVATTL